MIQTRFFIVQLVLVFFLTLNCKAQISGIVTINSGQSTGGTNYQTFSALALVLNTSGISGPLTVNVVAFSGPYIEQVVFNQAAGTSNNTITINGNSNFLTFNSTNPSFPYTLLLNGAKGMFFNNLNITATGSTYAMACNLYNGANNNVFRNCLFDVSITSTAMTACPFSISGSSTSYSAGTAGHDNAVISSTLSGGFFGAAIHGPTATTTSSNNQIRNCQIRDFYTYGILQNNAQGTLISGNRIERPFRGNSPFTCYGIRLMSGSYNCLIERNHILRMSEAVQTATFFIECISVFSNSLSINANHIQNNLISDIRSDGHIYGFKSDQPSFVNVFHNTFSFDDLASTGNGTSGIYLNGNENVKNNVISITRGGAPSVAIRMGSPSTTACDNNVLYVNSAGSQNFVGMAGSSNYTTLTSWQSATGKDLSSSTLNPVFTNTVAFNYVPTNLSLNNMGTNVNVLNDYNHIMRLSTPDAGAFEFPVVPCTGAAALTPTVFSSLCPNTSPTLNISSPSFTAFGYSTQIFASVFSPVGPFTQVYSGSLTSYVGVPITQPTWYMIVNSCTNTTASSTITLAIPVLAASISVSGNSLCAGTPATLIASGGTSYTWSTGAFTNSIVITPSATTVYSLSAANNTCALNTPTTNVQMVVYPNPTLTLIPANPTVCIGDVVNVAVNGAATYTWSTGGQGNSILLTPTATTGHSVIGSTTNSCMAVKLFSITVIQLPTVTLIASSTLVCSGQYVTLNGQGAHTYTISGGVVPGTPFPAFATTSYSIIGTSTLTGCSSSNSAVQTISVNPSPVISLNVSANPVCFGTSVTLIASGAHSYTWSNGITNGISFVPGTTANYTVNATDSVTGCKSGKFLTVTVHPVPTLTISSSSPSVCVGNSVALAAIGAFTYTWNNGVIDNKPFTPQGDAYYTVKGTNQFGCEGSDSVFIDVVPLPILTVQGSNSISCRGDQVAIIAGGAKSYQWSTGHLTATISVNLLQTTTFTVVGADSTGCFARSTFTQEVVECLAIRTAGIQDNGIEVFPNPSIGFFSIRFRDKYDQVNVTLRSLDGKLIRTVSQVEDGAVIEISDLSPGLYFLYLSYVDQQIGIKKIIRE